MSQTAFYPTQSGETPYTFNQQYNQAIESGKFKGSFADFMKKAEEKGWLDKGIDTLGKIKTWIGGDEDPASTLPDNNKKPFQISGTTKTLLIVGGIILIGLVGYGVYRATKK